MILPEPIKGILFDLDDTLYDRRKAFDTWTNAFIRERLKIDDRVARREIADWVESLDANGYGSKHAVMTALCERFPSAAGDVETFYDQFIDTIALDAATGEMLTELASMDIPFGIVTNGSERQWLKIRALDLEQRTPCVFVSATFGASKPDASIFRGAAECLGVAPANIIFVGDNPVNDIQGARNAGMQTAWLHREQQWPPGLADASPDITLDRLTELPALLNSRLQGPADVK